MHLRQGRGRSRVAAKGGKANKLFVCARCVLPLYRQLVAASKKKTQAAFDLGSTRWVRAKKRCRYALRRSPVIAGGRGRERRGTKEEK